MTDKRKGTRWEKRKGGCLLVHSTMDDLATTVNRVRGGDK